MTTRFICIYRNQLRYIFNCLHDFSPEFIAIVFLFLVNLVVNFFAKYVVSF